MAKDTFYFSHDYNAMSDGKIKNLICEHGLAGYGAYWAIVEMLYNNANALRTQYKSIAFDLHTDESFIKSIINDFDLFVIENGFFGSASVERRINERNHKSDKARESALYRWNKIKEDANALQLECDGNAIKERKGKESIGEEREKEKEDRKTKPQKRFVKPTILEISEYCQERGNDVNPTKFFNFYESKGWVVGKTPMKDWKAAVRTWETKNNKPTEGVAQIDKICYFKSKYSGQGMEIKDTYSRYEREVKQCGKENVTFIRYAD